MTEFLSSNSGANRPQSDKAKRQTVGLFGGTFDPVHHAHLRMALELKQRLQLDQMRLLPCHQPPHKDNPERSSEHRANMVALALESCNELSCDVRELAADKPSYTIDTLEQLRGELGEEVSLCWCVGMDSLVNLSSWHRWRELLDVAHLVVTARPGWQMPTNGDVAEWLESHRGTPESLTNTAHGSVVVCEMSLLDISATDIREQIAAGHSPQFLMPDAVWRYIQENDLYN